MHEKERRTAVHIATYKVNHFVKFNMQYLRRLTKKDMILSFELCIYLYQLNLLNYKLVQ